MITDNTERACVIIESPFAGNTALNLRYARRCMMDSIRRMEAPFASHLLYTQPFMLHDSSPYERFVGITCGLAWAERSSYSAFYTDLGWSPGMLAALHDFNLKRNHPFRLRSLKTPTAVKLPASIDADLETLLRAYIEE